MKCPYPNCQKDYNDDAWSKICDGYVGMASGLSENEKNTLNRVYLISRRCHFCHQLFHELYIRHSNPSTLDEKTFTWNHFLDSSELIATYPTSKTSFESAGVPEKIRKLFYEAERCRSIGALTGVSACLRKAVYTLCDDKKSPGGNYREKIETLPLEGQVYKELLKQVKFLGDNMTKPEGDDYTQEQVDIALSVLPVVIDKLYEQDEKIETAGKILAQVRSKSSQGNQA